ncbi:hypothetical protein [Actinocrispum wychmicini]|uniref:Uncharacterized protein n=1 Tax=Actinocrispum wychmicini TaxID=1213861 RepID=A0A4R2KDD7_9PSEU|nr:hypothetical protein [Actinocrispum wychmicini]TCO64525.1 hypothetical protein EV192_101301 [Actinocrispum wychmicini]
MFEIVPGYGLDVSPKLVLGNLCVCVGTYADPEAHEKHFLQTVGSGNWYFSEDDEFRFDPVTGVLRSVRLHIPERNATHHVPPDLPAEPGSIRLTRLVPFSMEPAALRWFADGRLTCLYTVDTPDRRVRVAPDFDLFFSAGELSGWSLARTGEPEFAGLLADYFALVTESTIERLEHEDQGVLRELQELAERVGTSDDARTDLHGRISYMVDFFSG